MQDYHEEVVLEFVVEFVWEGFANVICLKEWWSPHLRKPLDDDGDGDDGLGVKKKRKRKMKGEEVKQDQLREGDAM